MRNMAKVLDVLDRDGEATPQSVANELGITLSYARQIMSQAAAQGVIVRVAHGRYRRARPGGGLMPLPLQLNATCRPGWLRLAIHAARAYADRLTDCIEETDGPLAVGLLRLRRNIHMHIGRLEASL